MSLTITSFSLIGAFLGAVVGVSMAYPDGKPGKYAAIGAIAGALVLGGGTAVVRNGELMDSIKSIFVTQAQPLADKGLAFDAVITVPSPAASL